MNNVIFDVGANNGLDGLGYALFNKNLNIYAFEANPELVKKIQFNKNLIENFENHIDPKDPTNNCLDVAIITAPEKRTQKTIDKLKTVEEKLQSYLSLSDEVMNKLKWLGVFENVSIGLDKASPAEVLQKLLESKWSLESKDKDMIVMQHQFHYQLEGKEKSLYSSLVLEGKDQIHTAMSMTVGLPVAIATKLILKEKIQLSGVQIPVIKEIYEPVLQELKSFGIDFIEEEK